MNCGAEITKHVKRGNDGYYVDLACALDEPHDRHYDDAYCIEWIDTDLSEMPQPGESLLHNMSAWHRVWSYNGMPYYPV
jgi:hypothetical protein